MKPIVITDVKYRMSLSIIRSLGRRKINITAVESQLTPKAAALGFYSRYIDNKLLFRDSCKDQEGFIQDLISYAKKLNTKPVLLPVGIYSIIAVSKNKDILDSYYDFLIPNEKHFNTANDKYKLIELAKNIGVPIPYTTTLQADETIEALSNRLTYPVIIKYRQGELLKLPPEKRYIIIKDGSSFINAFEAMHKLQSYPIVQEYIEGNGYGVSVIFDRNSEPVEIFCHKRIREYPITGGPSCFCESFWDDRMVGHAVKLLKELEWQGIAMVEFKGNPNDKLVLMEINPRIWGSFPLTAASGSSFSYKYYNAAQRYNIEQQAIMAYAADYKTGKKLRYILQDLLSFKGYYKVSDHKLKFLLCYLKDLINPAVSDGVFDIRDIKASLQYFKQALKKL